MRFILFAPFVFVAQAAFGACPPLPDRTAERTRLLETLASADMYNAGREAVNNMWAFWRVAPDEAAQEMLNGGLGAIRIGDLITAESVLSDLVTYCPDYAEGYNQLAFAYFLRNEDARAEALLKKTLELEPRHFGAFSGLGLIYIRTNRPALGQIYLRKGVEVNPWLNERSLLEVPAEGDDL